MPAVIDAKAKTDPDPYEIWLSEGPFAGFSISRAELLQDALCGHEVLVRGFHSEKRGVFRRILLPGEMTTTLFDQCYDLEIDTDWHGRKCGSAMSWHISVGAVKRFEVIGPEYGFCEDCCLWVPKEDLRDLYEPASSGRRGRHRMCCRRMTYDGTCL